MRPATAQTRSLKPGASNTRKSYMRPTRRWLPVAAAGLLVLVLAGGALPMGASWPMPEEAREFPPFAVALPSGDAQTKTDVEIRELKAQAPTWWTTEVKDAAIKAGADGKLYNPLADEFVDPPKAAPLGGVPAGSPDYLFIRPGALFLGGSGALCTYNFIWGAGTQIGTAGHCVSFVGETVFILSVPAPTIPLVTALGTVDSFQNAGIGNDWALIDINPAWHFWVDPNMAYLGGPSCSEWNGAFGAVKHVGHGIQTGLVASVPRISQANSGIGNSFNGIGEVSGGDSGSPMIKIETNTGCIGGSAAGIVTHCAAISAVCLPQYWATDVRSVPATVTTGLDPL